jgi:uridylate kinase
MKSIVISIGGSVIFSDQIDITYFEKLNSILKKITKKYKIYIIIGGGKTSRTYINFGRKIGLKEETLDQFGIDITRINAKILSYIIENSNTKIPKTTSDAKKIKKPITIMGGTTPGHSTDMVGAELAEKTKAIKYIIATNVEGVYDKDPNVYTDAKQIKEIKIDDLIEKFGTNWNQAGKNIVIDGPALKIIKKAKIPTLVLNGKKLTQLEKAINNQTFNGTIIKI